MLQVGATIPWVQGMTNQECGDSYAIQLLFRFRGRVRARDFAQVMDDVFPESLYQQAGTCTVDPTNGAVCCNATVPNQHRSARVAAFCLASTYFNRISLELVTVNLKTLELPSFGTFFGKGTLVLSDPHLAVNKSAFLTTLTWISSRPTWSGAMGALHPKNWARCLEP